MNEVQFAETIKKLTAPFLQERGFSFRYFYEKGGDSSCVYICRFQKGKDYFDIREISGKYELHIVVYANGEYRFPTLQALDKKAYRAFVFKHLFKKPTIDERRAFALGLLEKEWQSDKPDFFGIRKQPR